MDALPLSRATVYRILKHLVAQEYLVRTPDLKGFALGVRLRSLLSAPQDPASASYEQRSTTGHS